jgi:hypothetical protein
MVHAYLVIRFPFRKGVKMNSKLSIVKDIVVAAALAAGVSGVARADSDLNPLVGDSYAYFNGCNQGQTCKRVYNTAPSTFRQSNPGGLSERQFEVLSLSSGSAVFQTNAPVIDKAPSSFALSHPHGISEREFQALSSEGPAWHTITSAVTSTNTTVVAKTAAK